MHLGRGKNELKNQGVTDAIKVSIKRDEHMIQTNTYIKIFNTPQISAKKQTSPML